MEKRNFLEKLDSFNIEHYQVGDNVMIPCCFHGDKKPSLGVNLYKKKYNCFGCEAKGSGQEAIDKLFKTLFEGDDEGEFFFDEDEEKSIDLSYLLGKIEKIKTSGRHKEKIKILKNFRLEDYDYPYEDYADYLLGRNIKESSWKKFNIRCGEWKGSRRILVPMKDEYGRLVSIFGRSIDDDGYFRIRKSKSSDANKILFGWNHLKKRKTGLMVEGEIDTIYLQQFNLPAFGVGKKYPSDIQLMKIGKYMKKVFVGLDGDVEKEYIKKMLKRVGEYCEVEPIFLPKNKDPNKLTEEEVKKYYNPIRKWDE